MRRFNFSPASRNEQMIFGAERPGYGCTQVPPSRVQEWVQFMKEEGITGVCCLLPPRQLGYYERNLLRTYRKEFGPDNVCWVPVKDFHLIRACELRWEVLPFLKESDLTGEPAVVHCSGGSGRTGHVLAAWLVFGRSFSVEDALQSVVEMSRNPYEAVSRGNATMDDLHLLLRQCQQDVLS